MIEDNNFLLCYFGFFLTFLIMSRIKSKSKTFLTDKLRKKTVRENKGAGKKMEQALCIFVGAVVMEEMWVKNKS